MTPTLCETCQNMREVRTARSRFLLCELSVTNADFPKYPPQPVEVGRFDAARDRVPAVKEENLHGAKAFLSFKQFGQYHGAGVFTGFGLRLRHLAQR